MPARFWVALAALLDRTRVDKWHRRCGAGVPSLPPRARCPPGAAIAALYLCQFLLLCSLIYFINYVTNPPPPSPFPPALFSSDRSHYKQTCLSLRLRLSAVAVIVSSPARTILPGKFVVNYCFITLVLMGGKILHPPPPLCVRRPTCSVSP